MKLHGLTVEQHMAWERDGYLQLDNFLNPQEVKQYDAAMDLALEQWRAKGRPNTIHGKIDNVEQVSGFIEYGELFLHLMEHPRMMNILRDVIGDSFVMIDNDIFVKYPGQAAHTSWHRDTDKTLYTHGKRVPFMVKVFYFTADVPYDGGCLSFIPGSRHMLDEHVPKVAVPEDMPGHVRMNVKAGTAVLFDGSTYHSALTNHSKQMRRSYIYNYGQMFLRTWPGYEPTDSLIADNANTPLRQMLLGLLPWTKNPNVFQD